MPTRRALLLSALPLLAATPPIVIRKLRTRKHTIGRRDYLFLEIETDGGITGLGEGSMSGRVEIVEQAIQFFAPYLTGKDPAGIEDHWNRNYYQLSRYRNGPILMTALAAVDVALWDIEGKRLGQPVWRLLGAAEAKPHARLLQPLEPGPQPAHAGASRGTRGAVARSGLDMRPSGCCRRGAASPNACAV